MSIFKNLWFSRFAEREGISDDELKAVVSRLEADQIDADLGGGVYKQRLARPGAGKSGGYRVILFFKSGDRTFFVYGFAKSDMDTISTSQLRDFKKTAKIVLGVSEITLEDVLKTGKYTEI